MEQTSEARIIYTPRSDATPEGELDAVSSVLKFILFESSASKKGTHPGAPDDVKESNGYVATSSISEPR
jgi:hypothetical protein